MTENMTVNEIVEWCKSHTCYQCDSENTDLYLTCRVCFKVAPSEWFKRKQQVFNTGTKCY